MKVSAIIPAYNEAERIGHVLDVICSHPDIAEVIAVDDGSWDDLKSVVQKYPRVRYVRSDRNRGKGQALELGSREATGDVLLFCDSDLLGLTTEMLTSVVHPVVEGRYAMFVGIFSTGMRPFYDWLLQGTKFPAGMYSGLRAMKRQIWELLPPFYKQSYLVEAGLNYLVRWQFGEPGYLHLSYRQIIKEKKYGIVEGTYLRWKMHVEVALAFLRIQLYERFFGFGKTAFRRVHATRVPFVSRGD